MIAALRPIMTLHEFRYVAFNLVLRDLRARYQDSLLGVLWTLIYPAILLAIWVTVFGTVMRFGASDYWAFLLSGLLPFQFLQSAIADGTSAVRRNAALIRKIYVPSEVLVISAITSKLVEFCIQMTLAVIAMLIFHQDGPDGRGASLSHVLVVLPAAVILTYVMAIGIALPLAAWSIIYRDLEHIASAALFAWLYLSPVFWILSDSSVQPWIRWLSLNPAMYLLDLFRGPLFYGDWPSNPLLGGPVVVIALATTATAFILVAGYMIFNRGKDLLAEVV
jgi:ABC-2 type transport system permease protein